MFGKGEFHSMAYDKVYEALTAMRDNPHEGNIAKVIKDVGRYSQLLSTKDIEQISREIAQKSLTLS